MTSTRPDQTLCPSLVMAAIELYVLHGIVPGAFLRACLENDLRGAITIADAYNLRALPHIVAYLVDKVPAMAWGSPALVEKWIARRQNDAAKRKALGDA